MIHNIKVLWTLYQPILSILIMQLALYQDFEQMLSYIIHITQEWVSNENYLTTVNITNLLSNNVQCFKKSESNIHKKKTNQTHLLQHVGIQIACKNNNSLYIGGNQLSSTVLGYLNTASSYMQSQLNNKKSVTGGNLILSTGGLIYDTSDLTSLQFFFTNCYM